MRRIRSGDFRMMRKRTEGSEMVEIEIGRNEAEQRLDRFLRKYLTGSFSLLSDVAAVVILKKKHLKISKTGSLNPPQRFYGMFFLTILVAVIS